MISSYFFSEIAILVIGNCQLRMRMKRTECTSIHILFVLCADISRGRLCVQPKHKRKGVNLLPIKAPRLYWALSASRNGITELTNSGEPERFQCCYYQKRITLIEQPSRVLASEQQQQQTRVQCIRREWLLYTSQTQSNYCLVLLICASPPRSCLLGYCLYRRQTLVYYLAIDNRGSYTASQLAETYIYTDVHLRACLFPPSQNENASIHRSYQLVYITHIVRGSFASANRREPQDNYNKDERSAGSWQKNGV